MGVRRQMNSQEKIDSALNLMKDTIRVCSECGNLMTPSGTIAKPYKTRGKIRTKPVCVVCLHLEALERRVKELEKRVRGKK